MTTQITITLSSEEYRTPGRPRMTVIPDLTMVPHAGQVARQIIPARLTVGGSSMFSQMLRERLRRGGEDILAIVASDERLTATAHGPSLNAVLDRGESWRLGPWASHYS